MADQPSSSKYFNAAEFPIKLSSFKCFSVSGVRQRNKNETLTEPRRPIRRHNNMKWFQLYLPIKRSARETVSSSFMYVSGAVRSTDLDTYRGVTAEGKPDLMITGQNTGSYST